MCWAVKMSVKFKRVGIVKSVFTDSYVIKLEVNTIR